MGRRTTETTLNVLIFPASTEIAYEIADSLRSVDNVKLFGASQPGPHAAQSRFRFHETVSSVHEPGWQGELLDLIRRCEIAAVFPAHDDVLYALRALDDLAGAVLITSSPEVCRITQSKRRTYEFLDGIVPTPTVFNGPPWTEFPVFVKPDRGHGSQGARKISTQTQLLVALEDDPELLVCEYLPGREFTVDCFSKGDGSLLYCRGRIRGVPRAGISMVSSFVEDQRFETIAQSILARLPMRGGWFFQVKEALDGQLKLLEIAPRIAGTMALSRVSGVNLPELSLYEQLGDMPDIITDPIQPHINIVRTLRNLYLHEIKFDRVFVSFENGLVSDGALSHSLLAFVAQCMNRKIQTGLVCEGTGDAGLLGRISGLFDEVLESRDFRALLGAAGSEGTIYVDRRLEVRRIFATDHPDVRCLSPQSVEILMDDRV